MRGHAHVITSTVVVVVTDGCTRGLSVCRVHLKTDKRHFVKLDPPHGSICHSAKSAGALTTIPKGDVSFMASAFVITVSAVVGEVFLVFFTASVDCRCVQ